MTLVISDVLADVTSHAGTTGQAIIDRLTHKNHQVKQALGKLVTSNTITVNIQGNGRWYANQFTVV